MKKFALYTIMHGNNSSFPEAKKMFQNYANFINADFIVSDTPKHSKRFLSSKSNSIISCLEKLEINALLSKYDRILYLDADITIMPHSPNIFDIYPDPNYAYLFNEGQYMKRNEIIKEILNTFQDSFNWPKIKRKPIYYNAGVILFSKPQHYFFDKITQEDLRRIERVSFFEQTYFNYLFFKHNIPISPLNYKFNYMAFMGTKKKRLKGYFIHYAGDGFTQSYKRRDQLLIDDYWTFCAANDSESPPKPERYYQWRKRLYRIPLPFRIPYFNYF